MLLRLEAERERELVADGWKETGRKKYEGLRSKLVGKGTKEERVVDLIVSLKPPLNYMIAYQCRSGNSTLWCTERVQAGI